MNQPKPNPEDDAMREQARNRIVSAMEDANMSQAHLSRQTGISTSTISAWKAGDRSPTWEQVILASEPLGLGLDYLIRGEEAARPPASPVANQGGSRAALHPKLKDLLGVMDELLLEPAEVIAAIHRDYVERKRRGEKLFGDPDEGRGSNGRGQAGG